MGETNEVPALNPNGKHFEANDKNDEKNNEGESKNNNAKENADLLRQLKIKKDGLVRTKKELDFYFDEVKENARLLQHLKDEGREESDIKHMNNRCEESTLVLNDTKKRFKNAFDDLQNFILQSPNIFSQLVFVNFLTPSSSSSSPSSLLEVLTGCVNLLFDISNKYKNIPIKFSPTFFEVTKNKQNEYLEGQKDNKLEIQQEEEDI